MLGCMAVDQYGNTYHIGDSPQRKWLLDHLGRKHAQKIYADTLDGKVRHVGYIIAGLWLHIYKVGSWKVAV